MHLQRLHLHLHLHQHLHLGYHLRQHQLLLAPHSVATVVVAPTAIQTGALNLATIARTIAVVSTVQLQRRHQRQHPVVTAVGCRNMAVGQMMALPAGASAVVRLATVASVGG